MSRLLFAAARGARIQLFNKWRGKWDTVGMVTIAAQGDTFRIHPEDAHLGYGPVSTALRKQSESDVPASLDIPYIGSYWSFTVEEANAFNSDQLHRSLFLLILAESLADEGL